MTAADDTPPIPTDREALEHDIEQTRAQLADTVEALAHKADVKAQVKEKGAELKESATQTATHVRESAAEAVTQAKANARRVAQRPPQHQAAAVGIAAALVALIWFVRLRRR
jgi:Protein of unknown function (DUF3618)